MRWRPDPLVLLIILNVHTILAQKCAFPERAQREFFFDINDDTMADAVIVDSVVEPADAQLKILNVRSNNIKSDFTSKLTVERHPNGQFLVVAKDSLSLPLYPSTINQTLLYVTVQCNGKPYPLITIRITNHNRFAPEFMSSTEELFLPNDAVIGTELDTEVIALDQDPSDIYNVKYRLDSPPYPELEMFTSDELVDLKSFPPPFSSRRYSRKQIPKRLKLRVLARLQKPVYYFNISASDGQVPEKQTSKLLKVVVGDPREIEAHFSQTEYFGNYSRAASSETEIALNQPILAIFPERGHFAEGPIKYVLQGSDFSSQFRLDPESARLYVKKQVYSQLPDNVRLTVKAFLEHEPTTFVTTKVQLTDASEVKLTYFSQCRYNAHIDENSPANTKIIKFSVKGDIDGIDLLNGTEYFEVSSDGLMTVREGAELDREKIELIVVKARLRSSTPLHPKAMELCQIATVDVYLDDVNDNSPRFDHAAYTFYTEEQPYNNTEIGSFQATDDDKGVFGKIKYRFLEEGLPFIIFQADGVATLYYVVKSNVFVPEKMYSFTIEAFDADEYPRTSRVAVRVFFGQQEADALEFAEPQLIDVNEKPKVKKNNSVAHSRTVDLSLSKVEEPAQSALDPSVRFAEEYYEFNLTGKIDVGEYVGTVRLIDDNAELDYDVEEGIRGFINIDPRYGTLRVGQKMAEDEYEQVRFAALVKNRRGQVLATTLVTVYVDERANEYALPPRFEQAIYRFEIEENQPQQSLAQIEAHHRAVELGKDKVWYTLDRTADSKLFKIDPESGWLASKKELDYEEKKVYNLNINGCLESSTKQCGHAEAIVVVKDLNDNEPVFEKPNYRVELPVDLAVGTEVLQVQAKDADSGANARLHYFISHDSGIYAEVFQVDEDSGELRLAKPLSRDVTEMDFYISVRDSGEPSLTGRVQVHVTVIGDGVSSNLYAPEFDDFRYEVSRRVPIGRGEKVGQVHAVDQDFGLDGRIRYKLVDNQAAKKFEINKDTGEIKTTAPVTVDDGQLIQLNIEAHDSSPKFSRKTSTVFLLHLLDNEEPLEFVPLPKTVYISNSKPVGSTIFKVALKNGEIPDVKYIVEQDPRHQLFGMIDDSLIVQLRLKPGIYRIGIRAFLPDKNYSTIHALKMVVMTDRDRYPVFEKLSYELKVAADADFPVKLPALPVSLKEGQAEYRLFSENGFDSPKGVKIDEITGELTIYEEFVKYLESELGRANAFLVIRSINQQYPEFFSDVGVSLGLKRNVHEMAFTSKLYRLIVRENSAPGTVINTVHIGIMDSRRFPGVIYTIQPSEYFDINEKGSVVLKKKIDLEDLPQSRNGIIDATITAQDATHKATTQVQIKIEDENEFSPRFDQEKYSFDIDEHVEEGQILGEVKAFDKDFTDQNNLVYSAKSGSAISYVDIRSDGKIVKSNGGDFEPGHHYNLVVQARDARGKTADVIVLFTIAEPKQNVISPISEKTHVMHKSDNWKPDTDDSHMMLIAMPTGNWDFKIMSGNDDKIFTLEKMNETVASLGLNKSAAGGKKPKPFLVVEATNLDDPFDKVETNVSVDLKALKPKAKLEFESAKSEEIIVDPAVASPNQAVFHVAVKGPKNRKFAIPETANGLFRIDEQTGDVFLTRAPSDADANERELIVTVSSGKQNIMKVFPLIIILPNTSPPPRLESTTIEISDLNEVEPEEQVDTVPTQVSVTTTSSLPATTKDTTLFAQKIIPNTVTGATTPSTTTPRQQTAASKVEEVPVTTEVTSTSDPTELHFKAEVYKFELHNPKPNDIVGKLEVANPAGTVKMNIQPEQYKQWFGVDPATTTIYVRQPPEDLEGRQRAEFVVMAQDAKKHRAEANVIVDLVLGEVDEPSTRKADNSVIPTASESFTSDSSLTEVSFPETTAEPPATTTTRIETVPPTTTTRLSSTTTDGSETTDNLFENTPDFNPSVQASKPNVEPSEARPSTPPKTDPSESPKGLFNQHSFTAILPEGNYGSRGAVVSLKPQSLKQSAGEDVSFEIADTIPSFPFYVRNDSGDLIAFANIDREQTKEYKFRVKATDKSSSQIDFAEVKITILDVNDNYPVFEAAPSAVGVDVNAAPQAIVATFKATDLDEGSAGKVTFRMGENPNNLFDINSSGQLMLSTKISALPENPLEISVVALDGGRPALKTFHKVRIEFFDDSSDQPIFHKKEATVTLPMNVEAEQFVYQFVAGVTPLSYDITAGELDLFKIEKSSGTIQLARTPRPAEQNMYHNLNVTAVSDSGKSAQAVLNVYLEGEPVTTTESAPIDKSQKCRFSQKIYNSEIKENTPGRNKLVTVTSNCAKQNRPVKYTIHQAAEAFELDENTGDLYVNGPLDREQKGMHFVVVNVTEIQRPSRQSNPITDFAKKKLNEDQALVVVKVVDENDNVPVFNNRNPKGDIIAVIDWQAPLLQPVIRLQASDADERAHISYSITPNDYFTVNETNGLIILTKPVVSASEDVFELSATADDGAHAVSIHKLSPGSNIVFLGVEKPENEIDEQQTARKLSVITGLDTRILVKQIFIDENGKAVLNKTHLFVYALDKATRTPVEAAQLKLLLENNREKLEDTDLKVSAIQLPVVFNRFSLSWAEAVLLGVSLLLLLLACCIFFFCLRCLKHRSPGTAKSDMEYMVDSQTAGPRPYNVELISRKTAQTVLSARPLPEAVEENTMTPESRASMITATLPNPNPQTTSTTPASLSDAPASVL